MKNLITFICMSLLCTNIAFAQEAGKLRTGMELGAVFPISGEISFFETALELKYNVLDNMNIGVKTEYAFVILNKDNYSEVLSFYSTCDYYLHNGSSRLSPFIGGGLGCYWAKGYDSGNYKIKNPACFVRSGIEAGKLRLSLTYNVIRFLSYFNSENYDYIALSAGFYIGGGKWHSKQPAAGKKLITQR